MESNTRGLSNNMTVIALVNGMIGGIILVMPILALKTGYLMIAPVVLISGFFSYYSCLLCLKHLKNYKDLDQAVLKHFDNKKGFKIFYDICISVSIMVLLILYFDLICKQWAGLISQSHIIAIINAIVLFPVVYIMKKYHFGASLLAYGIISTIGYCLFILYMWVNAPEGDNQLKPVDKHFPQLAAALSQGFAIQTMFIPILKKNPNAVDYKKLLGITYFVGASIYMFIGYGGSLSIVNKTYPGSEKPETITQFFDKKQWEVILLHIIYLVHLYSAFPQFLLISKKRFFSAVEWPQSSDVSFKQVLYVGIIILICLIIKLTPLSAQSIIQINGSVISFIFITVIPVSLHVKCVYFSEAQHYNLQDQPENKKEIQVNIQSGQSQKKQHRKEQQMVDQPQMKKQDIEKQQDVKQLAAKQQLSSQQMMNNMKIPSVNNSTATQCTCDIHYRSRIHKVCDMVLMICMVVSGIATMAYTLYLIYDDSQESTL